MDPQHQAIYAKEQKDVPDWMKAHHEWQAAVDINKLPKYQLKVKMCCMKCEEKVLEEIREVHGVFDVKVDRMNSKVVVVALPPPNILDEHEVLRKAKKIYRKAKFVELDASEKPKNEDNKKKEDDKKKAEEAKKQKEQHAGNSTTNTTYYTSQPYIFWPGQRFVPPQAGEYRPSQWYGPPYQYPPLPNQQEGSRLQQYVYYY
ncbi:uncharacterized protein [Physcomitrium patens]|uniref:HMA domain-containing protein n=2 Tax=Physcomitrium patens TaxID=3218 RepID=A0A2K1IZ36_PHYPA|nr:uncharacterized protein LOC112272879 isoform X1 [Physcomitrium patens]PNR34540.1 hypothetical protein PHYPA_024357 [Physcomitrium patens]|eukprot:XP_024356822.1 uncharacterized protein LOC112272879 isoform X1 [Physcomitrella patens]